MEEFDQHTEHVEEQLHEHAAESKQGWIIGVALTAAILAAFAAVSSLLSGHHEHEAMVEQIRASDQWSYYQAKGIKAAVLEERIENLQVGGQSVPEVQRKKLEQYKADQNEISKAAKELEQASRRHDHLHMVFAGAVTLFQIAIAVAAIAALARRKTFWYVGIVLGVIALGFVATGAAEWGMTARNGG